tara:strand:+ start:7340 stop:7567 length:228 start_codon:yes stop_codon:yes gene_type:complete
MSKQLLTKETETLLIELEKILEAKRTQIRDTKAENKRARKLGFQLMLGGLAGIVLGLILSIGVISLIELLNNNIN